MGIQIPADYRPQENEPFMNERQREYFRRKLNGWKEEILKESRETIQNLQAETMPACRSGRPRLDRGGAPAGTAHPRPPAQADRQDRCGAAPDRRWLLRFLRGDGRADFAQAPGCAAHRDPVHRSAGTPRAARKGLSRRLGSSKLAPAFLPRVAKRWRAKMCAERLARVAHRWGQLKNYQGIRMSNSCAAITRLLHIADRALAAIGDARFGDLGEIDGVVLGDVFACARCRRPACRAARC